jgi:ankyrin repeat protein
MEHTQTYFLCSLVQDGCTALIYAASQGNLDCVRLLLNAGADKDAKGNVRMYELKYVFVRFVVVFDDLLVLFYVFVSISLLRIYL